MKTIVEQSLADDEEIVFEGNTHHEAIRMKFEDFRRIEERLVASFEAEPTRLLKGVRRRTTCSVRSP